MPEKLWDCWSTFSEVAHRAKVFQVLREVALGNKAGIEKVARLDNFCESLFESIEQGNTKTPNMELRYAAIDLFGTLGCTDDRMSK